MANQVTTKFTEAEIAKDVLQFLPNLKTLKISYPSGVKVELDNVLTPTQVKNQPNVGWEGEGFFYTLLMTDPDAGTSSEVRHWLIVNIPGNDLSSGEQIFQYIGSGPPADSGIHRYVFLLFKQPNGKKNFDLPFVSDHSAAGRLSTSTKELVAKYNLVLDAGNFFRAEYDDYVPILHKQLSD